MFKVELSTYAKHYLKKAPNGDRNRIIKKIKELTIDPLPSDVKRVLGREEKVFRVRVGDYRILYVVLYKEKGILISNIDKRERVY